MVLGLVLLVTASFNFNVLLPVLAAQTLDEGPEVFGVVTAFFGAGALIGALTAASISRAGRSSCSPGTAAFGVAQLARSADDARRRGAVPLRRRDRLHALDVECELHPPARHARPAARPRHGPLLLRLQRRRPGAGGMLAGWLAATGGTALAFTVGGVSAIAVSAVAFTVLEGGGPRSAASPRGQVP